MYNVWLMIMNHSILLLTVLSIATPDAGRRDFPPDVRIARVSEEQTNTAVAPPSVRVTRSKSEPSRWSCEFTYRPDRPADSVHLAGDFNGWNPNATPMTMTGDGRYRTTMELDEGTRYYKFVVDGDSWRPDPLNPDSVHDGHGGANSTLRLGPEAGLDPGRSRSGDDAIEPAALEHEPARPIYRQILPDGRYLVRYRTLRGDCTGVRLSIEHFGNVPMQLANSDGLFDFWEIAVDQEADDHRYTFIVEDGGFKVRDESIYRLEQPEDGVHRTPDWAKDAIWYQIMIDRFRNGTTENDPVKSFPWKKQWYDSAEWEGRDGQTFYEWFVFDRMCGGDLQGLEEKLDYLSELGVNALYLNPVFQADTCHKYNATNFLHIDDRYGIGDDYPRAEAEEDLLDQSTWRWTRSDELFLEFLKTAKARGFRVIIDGVFNHVGTRHPAFRDVLINGRDSRFAEWFDVRSWDPFEYEGWAGFGGLPAFKKAAEGLECEAVKKHIFEITRRWMDPDGDGDPSDGIDGWRLDVPNEIAIPFWVDWCAHVRSINPDAYITGEIWDRADEWLDGRSFDAVMNYEFSKVVFDWVGARENKISASEADERLASLRMAYPAEVNYVLQNLIDSHDTDRAVSKIHNPDRPFDSGNREQDDPTYDGSKPSDDAYRRLELLALIQMTYIGAPMIYYGTEVGMWGSDDPNNRKTMIWEDLGTYEDPDATVMPELLDRYKGMIRLRNDHVALRRGSFETLLADDEQDLLVFRRAYEDETLLIALNAGDGEARFELPEGEWSPLHGDDVPGTVVAPISGRVWIKKR